MLVPRLPFFVRVDLATNICIFEQSDTDTTAYENFNEIYKFKVFDEEGQEIFDEDELEAF